MKIQYICHSCLFIDTGDVKIAIDPWYNGPAYLKRWHVFPPPLETNLVEKSDFILLSHGHEDHLHPETLKKYRKDATLFFPYQWRGGIKKIINDIGISKIVEAVSFISYRLSPTTKLTYVGFALESIMVIESGGQVFVNLNDALNSHHQNVVNMFLIEIKKRWPHIDYLFSGWSGAGYFPNTVHFPGKDDVETGKIREQYFANHFCKIIKELNPDRAIPFAPGFVLLDPTKRWINDLKFPREELNAYYHSYFDSETKTGFYVMHPGDYFESGAFHDVSAYRSEIIDGSLNHMIEKIYAGEIRDAAQTNYADENSLNTIIEKLLIYTNKNASIYHKNVLAGLAFRIKFSDIQSPVCIKIEFCSNAFEVSKIPFEEDDKIITLVTTSHLLEYSLDHVWGGDVLTIGYGIDVYIHNETDLEKNLDIVCVRLITRYPRASTDLIKRPLRALKYFVTNPGITKLAVKQKLRMKNTVNKFPYNERDHWVSYSKCELCRVCDLPLLSFEFGETLSKPSAV